VEIALNYERIKFLSGAQDGIAAAGDEDKHDFFTFVRPFLKFSQTPQNGVLSQTQEISGRLV
jgi:hypothetical protein